MHADAPKPSKEIWHQRLVRSGYFVGTVFLHLIVFIMVATLVIFQAPAPPPTDVFQAVAVKTSPPPSVPPPASGAAANNPQIEPDPVTVPVVTRPWSNLANSGEALRISSATSLAVSVAPKGER